MKNDHESVEINHTPNWPYIPYIPGLGSGKTNMLLNLIKHQRPDIDKIYLYVKDPLGTKYLLLIKRRAKLVIGNLKNPKAFIDMEFNKELILIVTDLFLREKKLKISLVFIGRSYFKVPNKNYKTKSNALFYHEHS